GGPEDEHRMPARDREGRAQLARRPSEPVERAVEIEVVDPAGSVRQRRPDGEPVEWPADVCVGGAGVGPRLGEERPPAWRGGGARAGSGPGVEPARPGAGRGSAGGSSSRSPPRGSCTVAASATSKGPGSRRRRLRRGTEQRRGLLAEAELVGLPRARAREVRLAAEEEVARHLVDGEL